MVRVRGGHGMAVVRGEEGLVLAKAPFVLMCEQAESAFL